MLSSLVALFALVPETAAPAETVYDIRQVVLATGGIAEIVSHSREPHDTVRLELEREHIADVLRSLVISGDVAVQSIEAPAAESASARSAQGRLINGGLDNPFALLNTVIGEDITIHDRSRSISGKLLAAVEVMLPGATADDPEQEGARVSLLTADGQMLIETFPLSEQFGVAGKAVNDVLANTLPALREAKSDQRRTVRVRLSEPAHSQARFVIPTTVWRPSYRAVLDEDGAKLQGWATLENTTGFDWNGVDLQLAVGTPVTYDYNIYEPLRVPRPPAPLAGRHNREFAAPVAVDTPLATVLPSRAAIADDAHYDLRQAEEAIASAQLAVGGPAITESAVTVFDIAGEIDLDAGRTLTVPFLEEGGLARRSVHVDLAAPQPIPMDALVITPSNDVSLPAGLISVFGEAGYLGDAAFFGAQTGDVFIAPFAAAADVDITHEELNNVELAQVELKDGGLVIRRDVLHRHKVEIRALSETEFVIDVPLVDGDTIKSTLAGTDVKAVRTADNNGRLDLKVDPGRHMLVIETSRPVSERHVVGRLPNEVLSEAMAAGDRLPEDTLETLRQIAELSGEIRINERRAVSIRDRVADLRSVMEIDRETITALGPDTPEGRAVRDSLVRRTTEIDSLLNELRDIHTRRIALEKRLGEF